MIPYFDDLGIPLEVYFKFLNIYVDLGYNSNYSCSAVLFISECVIILSFAK